MRKFKNWRWPLRLWFDSPTEFASWVAIAFVFAGIIMVIAGFVRAPKV